MIRNDLFPEGEIYHICNKSIANYGIFKDPGNARRFLATLEYYNQKNTDLGFSEFLRSHPTHQPDGLLKQKDSALLKFLSYCIMPDHYHILVRVRTSETLSRYINTVQSSFTRYFNVKFDRKGPLWQSRFRAARITSNELVLHVSRYQHLNPTTASLVKKPEDWEFSSYREYIFSDALEHLKEISISDPKHYKKFCDDQIEYQKTLKKIKNVLLE